MIDSTTLLCVIKKGVFIMQIIFSADQTAKILRMSVGHLCKMRTAGKGPVPTYFGRNVRYTATDIADYINAGRQTEEAPTVSVHDLIRAAHYADVDAALSFLESHGDDLTDEQRTRLARLSSRYSASASVARALSIVDGVA